MTPDASKAPKHQYRQVAFSLKADRITAEIWREARKRELALVAMKGPAIGAWLYRDGGLRPYGDTDLLIRPGDLARGQQMLRHLGFRPWPDTPATTGDGIPHRHAWWNGDHAVDLDSGLVGVEAPGDALWDVARRDGELLTIGGEEVEVPGETFRTFHLALHAAQHGTAINRPLADLERGLEQLPQELWRAAAGIALELDAREAFVAGLGLTPRGRALLEQLGLDAHLSTRTRLRAASSPPTALGFERLGSTPGLRERARLLLREVAPPKEFLLWWSPLARRGPIGLALVRVYRAGWIIRHGPAGYAAWRREHRATATTGGHARRTDREKR